MQLKTLFAGLITLTIIGAPTLVRADEPGRHPHTFMPGRICAPLRC